MDSAWLALKRLNVPAQLQFCCDTDKKCKALLQGLHKPRRFFEDVSSRTPEQDLPVHVFVMTPPCQAYSSNGKRQGIKDARGRVMKCSFSYIKRRRPRVVLFENVTGILHKKHKPVLLGMHKALKELGYKMWLKTLDSSQFKVPQIRRRVFIVAILKTSLRRKFCWPKGQGVKTLSSALDPWQASDKPGRLPVNPNAARMAKIAYRRVWEKGTDPRKTVVAVDVGCTERFLTYGVDMCRTLCRGRAGSGGFWLSTRGRTLTLTEMLKVNGTDASEMKNWEDFVSETDLRKMLGNSVPVPMIGEVLQEAMWAAGLLSKKEKFPC